MTRNDNRQVASTPIRYTFNVQKNKFHDLNLLYNIKIFVLQHFTMETVWNAMYFFPNKQLLYSLMRN